LAGDVWVRLAGHARLDAVMSSERA
jgi:hypothetical protein